MTPFRKPAPTDFGYYRVDQEGGLFYWYGTLPGLVRGFEYIPAEFEQIQIPYFYSKQRAEVRRELARLGDKILISEKLTDAGRLKLNKILAPFETEIEWWGQAILLTKSRNLFAVELRRCFWLNQPVDWDDDVDDVDSKIYERKIPTQLVADFLAFTFD